MAEIGARPSAPKEGTDTPLQSIIGIRVLHCTTVPPQSSFNPYWDLVTKEAI